MAFTPPDYFATALWGQREGDDQTDPQAALMEIRPGEWNAVDSARLRLFYQWAQAASWQLFMAEIGAGQALQELALGSVDQARYLSAAEGDVLTEIGALVNRPRQGLEDDDLYRLAIKAEAGSLFTSGTVPEILGLVVALMGPLVRVVELYPGMIMIQAPDVAADVFLVLLDVLADVPAAGVGALLVTWDSDLVGTYGSTTGATEAPIGRYGSTTGASTGLSWYATGQPIGDTG